MNYVTHFMGKIRIPNKFGQTPNQLLNDQNISLKAKGLYGYMQAKDDNWEFSIAGLECQLKEGQDAIRQAIKELEIAGWLTRYNYQNDKGQWDCDYELQVVKVQNNQPLGKKPYRENPYAESSVPVKPACIIKKDNTKKDNKAILKNKQKEKPNLKFDLILNEDYQKLDPVEVRKLTFDFWTTKKGAKTELAFNILLKTLNKMTVENQIKSLEQAIISNYSTVYEIVDRPQSNGYKQYPKAQTQSQKEIQTETSEYGKY